MNLVPEALPKKLAGIAFWFDVLGVGLFCILVGMTLLGVIARYLLLPGVEWSFEVAGIAFVWIVFIGTITAELRRQNMAFEAFVTRFSPGNRRRFAAFSAFVLLVVALAMGWSALGVVDRTAHVLTPVLRIPSAVTTLAAFVFSACAVAIALFRLWTFLRDMPDGEQRAFR
jgi:TRAP-type transport system small permease protein